MEIITGYRGEPHITSAQDRATNQGCFGEGSYILDVGSKLEPEIISANEIRINDGVLSHQGCVANIALGTYDSLTISNGSQGMKRADLIVARYTRDSETLVEDIELVVIEGTPASGTPVLPSYNEGDIQAGDSPVDMPLYRVNLDGVSIDSIDQIASNVKTQADMSEVINALGTYYVSSANITVPSGIVSWTELVTISLPVGRYIMTYGGSFGADSNGYRQIYYTTSSSAPTTLGRDGISVEAVSGAVTIGQTTRLLLLNSSATLHFWARQNSGSSLTLYFQYYITRIR